ncbi:MAG: propionyl-CoA synthetase [Granulosicoccus sp.]|nr:propionyl-CoA synthetase [Granulosicoccus sp.]
MADYQTEHQRSLADPSAYWLERARDVHWFKSPTRGIDTSRSPYNTWFDDGEINACYNALDVHVENGRGEQPALIHDSPVTDSHTTFSYRQLRDQVARFAGVLRSRGIERGDRVLIYMPMIPQAVIAVLACARLGAIHSVVFGGFAARELAVRINDCSPKLIVSASCGIEPGRVVEYQPLVNDALQIATAGVSGCIVFQRPQSHWAMTPGRDLDWDAEMAEAEAVECVPVNSTHPLYILYTSGTTGSPKGVVKDTGGTVVSLKWTMSAIYNVQPGDVYWAASDIGWVVGHSYIIYGPLFKGCTTVMYEGKPVGTPDAGAFWRVIEQNRVKVLFTAPTAFRAIKRVDPEGSFLQHYDISGLQALYLAGERCDPDTLQWAQDKLKVPVIDHWWQTETGYSICANCQGIEPMPVVPGSPSVAVPGYDVQILDEDGTRVATGDIGSIVVKLPLPPGTFINLWGAEARYKSGYFDHFPGYYETGDAGFIDDDGYVFVMARTDDVINVAGHRLSTGAMEEALSNHPDVAECAVMGVHDELKGQLPVGLVILNDGCTKPHEQVKAELIKQVRDDIGPVAAFKLVAVVDKLPKTRSGKILRGTLRSIANSTEWNMPATIEDPSVLEDVTQSLRSLGLAREPS